MKTILAYVFMLVLATRLTAQEVMENSDFSDGTTHWHGDCKTAGAENSTDFTSTAATSAAGIVVDLHAMAWTKITQEIHGYKGAHGPMVLSIVYQASPDLKLSTRDADYANVGQSAGFGGAHLQSQPGQVTALIDMPPASRASLSSAGSYNIVTVYYDKVASASFAPSTDTTPQTFTATFVPPAPSIDINPTFCLAFPPGSGSVTLLKISLTPADAQQGGQGN